MSAKSEANLKGIPSKPYDLLREGLIVFAFAVVVIVVLAALFGSPDYPSVTAQEVAQKQPVDYLKLVSDYLSGNSDMQTYGPPYTRNPENAQGLFGLAPANILGVTIPIDAQKDFVLKPLEALATISPSVKDALGQFQAAADDQRNAWVKNYTDALDKAEVSGQSVQLAPGDYGPVPVLMNGMLDIARAGFLEGALNSGPNVPYAFDNTKALMFLEGDIQDQVAGKLDMQGGQWGIGHETGNYPGAWWLWPYTFLYQIPAIGNADNADIIVGAIMALFFLVLIFLPLIPVLNRIPYWVKVYRVIWRDWYRDHGKS
ncbi:MAG TPA: hypothetical protein VMW87_08175 [Spirochaetia bacterium]|nr:hypothetical protein [Spirochaetia bacterium]